MNRKPKANAKIAKKKKAKITKIKEKSDIFICKRATGEYWAYPSPFVVHRPEAKIQFRNLTSDDIEIDFGEASVSAEPLQLAGEAWGVVTLSEIAGRGLCEYVATVLGKHHVLRGSQKRQPVLVKGGSPPEIIIDT